MLAASVAVLVAVIVWPVKRPEEKKLPEKSEILGMMQEQSQIATTEVTIRKMAIYDSDTQIASLNPAKWKLGKRVCVVPVDGAEGV